VSELWWVGAAIPVDREPDWVAAYAAAGALSIAHRDCTWEEYVAQLLEPHVAAADVVAAAPLPADSATRDALLPPHVRRLVRQELEMVVAAHSRGRPYVCALDSVGLLVVVDCSGYASVRDRLWDG
jgi:hypothetical protein